MPRFREILIPALALWLLAEVAASAEERNIIWIAKHLHNTEDYSEQIVGELSRMTTFLPDELDVQRPLADLFRGIEAIADPKTGLRSIDLEEKYRTNVHSLIALSGSGINDPANIESLVYLGPSTSAFRQKFAKLRLLTIATNPAAERYLQLLLFYAVIKASEETHADIDQVIRPLSGKALEYVAEAHVAQPKIVELIEADLRQILN